jgi:hypothetical protein
LSLIGLKNAFVEIPGFTFTHDFCRRYSLSLTGAADSVCGKPPFSMTTLSAPHVGFTALLRRRTWSIYLFLFFIGTMLWATTVVPPKFTELVNESDYIVRALVKSVKSEWREKDGQRHIFTKVEVEVLEIINGTPPQPLVLEMLGGKVGEDEMVIEGMPKFAVGQEDILFIRGNGHQFFPLTAAMHGRYPVVREKSGRAYVMRNNQIPLHDTAEVALPMSEDSSPDEIKRQASVSIPGLSPENFVQQIRSAVNVNYQRTSARAN